MTATERVEYDEFGLFHENAAEYGLPYDGPPTVRREHVEVEPGRRLSALVWGEGEPELVLLHGGSQNAHTWDTVAMALRPTSLVAIDLPGHGHSDGPGERQRADRSPRGAADDVAVAIRALAPDARGVVGMSYGGLTTIALTETAPDLVRKIVLVDVLPGLNAEHARHIVDFVNGPATFPTLRRPPGPDHRVQSDAERLVAATGDPAQRRPARRRKLGVASFALATRRWRAVPGRSRQPAAEAPLFDDLLDTLGRIQVPLLLARGMRPDSVLRDDDEAELLRRLPSAEVVHFEEAGHSIQGDMPVELAATIQDVHLLTGITPCRRRRGRSGGRRP